jgi:transcriptional regulator with XRE-family HTH domain
MRVDHKSRIGRVFSNLTVTGIGGRRGSNQLYVCECACGKSKSVSWSSLVTGNVKSCGCLRYPQKDKPVEVDTNEDPKDKPAYRAMAKQIKKAREINGFTIEEAASILDLAVSHLMEIEKGKLRPDYAQILMMAEEYDVTLDYLVSGRDSEIFESKESVTERWLAYCVYKAWYDEKVSDFANLQAVYDEIQALKGYTIDCLESMLNSVNIFNTQVLDKKFIDEIRAGSKLLNAMQDSKKLVDRSICRIRSATGTDKPVGFLDRLDPELCDFKMNFLGERRRRRKCAEVGVFGV